MSSYVGSLFVCGHLVLAIKLLSELPTTGVFSGRLTSKTTCVGVTINVAVDIAFIFATNLYLPVVTCISVSQ